MKKILFSLMAIALVVGLVGAGAFAYFSDTETSKGNTFTAGTLDVKVGGEDDDGSTVWTFTETDMKPGDEGQHDFLVTNAGNISGMLSIKGENIVNSPGTTPEPEVACGTDLGELGAAIDVLLWVGETEGEWYPGSGGLYAGPLDGLGGPYNVGYGVLPEYVHFYWSIVGDTVGNEIMDDSVSFDIVFSLDQA